jgi:hypothetical protein
MTDQIRQAKTLVIEPESQLVPDDAVDIIFKVKDFNPFDFILRVTDPEDDGYVDWKEFTILDLLAKYPLVHQRKKLVEKV